MGRASSSGANSGSCQAGAQSHDAGGAEAGATCHGARSSEAGSSASGANRRKGCRSARVASHGKDYGSSTGSDCGEDRAGASPSDYGNNCASSNDLNASTGNGDFRTDANDYYGCPHGGDHLPYDECRILSTNDNHGNLCHGRRLCSTNDNDGWRLRAVTNHFVGQLTMSRLAGSFDYEFWRFLTSADLYSAGNLISSN